MNTSDHMNIADVEPTMIHLLFVPTAACNLRCDYCYLSHGGYEALESPLGSPHKTLAFALNKLLEAEVLPFTVSLHGGEVTCLVPEEFEALVALIDEYYHIHANELAARGYSVGRPHIKTNLYGIDRHLDAIARYHVSVSGSLDVPFSLHRAHRRTVAGGDSLDRIMRNIELLADLPVKKKVSATLFHEHLDHLEDLCNDLERLHENTCLDMNDFNFMIGFAEGPDEPAPLTPGEQVRIYEALRDRFLGTDLEPGLTGPWFAEFSPDYCTGCTNCGERFFLLDAVGDVWSCVRGRGHEEFHYGNIFSDSVEHIMATARMKIFAAHNAHPLEEECTQCAFLRLCRTGCPFVKLLYHTGHSYTCALQRRIYADNPSLYQPSSTVEEDAYRYAALMHPAQAIDLRPAPRLVVPSDMRSLEDVLADDPEVAHVFDPDAFKLEIEGDVYPMASQVLRTSREIASYEPGCAVWLHVRKDILLCATSWPVNNSLYLMMLSGELVSYGDEGRTKQEHVFTHQVYLRTLERHAQDCGSWWRFDLTWLFSQYADVLSQERPNNFFATTSALRDCHYRKHQDNAFYHIQTINLPFPNLEIEVERP